MTETAFALETPREPVRRSGWGRAFDKVHAMHRGWGFTLDAPVQCRQAHVDRIKKHIARYPSKSICFPGDGQ